MPTELPGTTQSFKAIKRSLAGINHVLRGLLRDLQGLKKPLARLNKAFKPSNAIKGAEALGAFLGPKKAYQGFYQCQASMKFLGEPCRRTSLVS